MPTRRVTTFRIDDELLDGLRFVQERDGVLVSEQVRRAIRAWLLERGVLKKPGHKRAGHARKRP